MATDEQNEAKNNEPPVARIEKIFVKDVSFETPNSPAIFTMEWRPHLDFEIAHSATKLEEDIYEVVLLVSATTKIDDKTAYLAEIHQAGIFSLKVSNEVQLDRVVSIFCSRTLYPYACAAMSDLVTKGGFPQLILSPLNFETLYQKKIDDLARKQGEGES